MSTKNNPPFIKRRPFSEESFELARILSKTRDAIRKARQKELDQYHVHARRATLLLAVQSLDDRATPVAIGKWLLRERHSVSELLSKMENDGLVTKIWDLDRRNRVRVVLTPKGLEIYRKSVERESLHRIMSSLSEADFDRLRVSLQKLRTKALNILYSELQVPQIPNQGRGFELLGLLMEATDAVRKARQKELNEHGIDLAWSGVLLSVRALGDRATPVAIGKRLLRERHSVSEILSKMENDGLVKKIRDLDRRNRVRVVLTPKGLRLYEKSSKGMVFPSVISSLSQKERKHLKGCLRVLLNKAMTEFEK